MRKKSKKTDQWFLKKGILLLCAGLFCAMLVACQTTTTLTTTLPTTPTTTTGELDVISEDTHAVLYDGPGIMTSSEKVDIFVNDEEVFVYETLVNYGRVFSFTQSTDKVPVAIWDFEGKITVKIVVNDAVVTSAKVTPAGYGITPVITEGNTITFQLEYPTSYTVEYNDDYHNAIHLFTNRIEEETYDPENLPSDVLYIGPGVYKADNIPVHSDMTVYIAGGAVVYGKIRTENLENITIKGRGIIDGSIYPRSKDSEYTIPIELRYSQNITIDGITFLNPAGWCMAIYFCEEISIKNVNIITARGNGDGISVQSSKNVHVQNSFLRTWDDALVVKNYNLGTTENILFEDITIWTDLAQSMEVGYETYGATMTNIAFKNITVLHNFHKPVISIHNSDQAAISFVTFQNITVEDAQMIGDNALETTDDFLIEIFIRYNLNWSKSGAVRGSIDHVLIDNLVVLAGKADFNSLIHGADSTHRTDNVTLSNCKIFGEPVTAAEDIHLTTNEFTGNVNFTYDASKAVGARIYHPYVLNLPIDDTPVIDIKSNINQEGYLVPEFSRAEAVSSYMGPQVTGSFVVSSTRGTTIAIYDDGTGSYDAVSGGSALTIDGNKTTEWRSQAFTPTSAFYALTIKFDADLAVTKSIGTIRLYGNLDSEIYQIQKIAVYGIKAGSTAYAKLLSSDEYEFSPSSGNVVDIKIRSGEYKSIQLRFYDAGLDQSPDYAFLSEIEFYPASLSYNKAVTGTTHEDVYVINSSVDGNPSTYYLFNDPTSAKNLLMYRYHTLPMAKERALELDCVGACYPIATLNGYESCNLWQHASTQFQPSTAVAYGIMHYVNITNDVAFLEQYGLEILIEISRFLLSRGDFNPDRTKFGFFGVMGPDEFQMMVNHNTYTNLMAKMTFENTLKSLRDFEKRDTVKYHDLMLKTALTPAEMALFKEAMEKTVLLYDEKTKLFEQHQGYYELPHIDVDKIPETDFPLYAHWSYDRIYRNDMIKQPDVLMFMFLYNQHFTLEQKRANYEFYEPRCIHESSLSPSIHSVLATELGKTEEALDFFQFATRMDLDDYNRNTAEGLHLTSIAAAWVNIVYGFGGLRSDGKNLVMSPQIPSIWQSYAFKIHYRGVCIAIKVTQTKAAFTVDEMLTEPLEIYGKTVRLPIGTTEFLLETK